MTKEELKQEAEKKFKEWKSEQYKDQSDEERFEFVEHLHTFPKYFQNTFKDGYLASAEPREKHIAELEKENAELKEKLGDIQMQKAGEKSDLVWKLKTANEQKDEQLTNAKELLKRCYDNYIYLQPLRGDIEQFLKDSEVEK